MARYCKKIIKILKGVGNRIKDPLNTQKRIDEESEKRWREMEEDCNIIFEYKEQLAKKRSKFKCPH